MINKYIKSLSKNVEILHYIVSAGHLEILDGKGVNNISNEEILQIRLQKFARDKAKLIIKTQIEIKKFLYSILNDKHVKGLLKEEKYKIAQAQVKKMLNEWS